MKRELLPVVQVAQVAASNRPRWLVEGLWLEEGVGILGGCPKSCKTFLALDIALSVASGTSTLGHYSVVEAGAVLVFAAEDSPEAVKERLSGLADVRGLDLEELPLHLILSASLRLDTREDQDRLNTTLAHYRPKLLVLDPFVRLHRIDENSAREVSSILAYLRGLQREHHTAVLVVHHARKSQSAERAGMSLRGSGDFYAWADVNLYLARRRTGLELVIEHRSAPSPEPVQLELLCEDAPPHLALSARAPPNATDEALNQRILSELQRSEQPLTQDRLRRQLRVRMQRLVGALRKLETHGAVARTAKGFRLAG